MDGATGDGSAKASTNPERGMLGFLIAGFNFDFDLMGEKTNKKKRDEMRGLTRFLVQIIIVYLNEAKTHVTKE